MVEIRRGDEDVGLEGNICRERHMRQHFTPIYALKKIWNEM